jgi:hypothetical protein
MAMPPSRTISEEGCIRFDQIRVGEIQLWSGFWLRMARKVNDGGSNHGSLGIRPVFIWATLSSEEAHLDQIPDVR